MLRMRFGSFVWPNNPRTYTISCKRQTAVHKVPMGGFVVQDLGRTATVMKGEGEFFGAYAYSTFLELQAVFQKGGRGTPGRMTRFRSCCRSFRRADSRCWCIRCGRRQARILRSLR